MGVLLLSGRAMNKMDKVMKFMDNFLLRMEINKERSLESILI